MVIGNIGGVGGVGRLGLARNTGVRAWPPRGEDGALPLLALDFVADRYWWGGALHTRAELTTLQGTPTWGAEGVLIDGTDRLQVPAASVASWFAWTEGTALVEWQRSVNTAEGTIFSLRGGSGGTSVRVEFTVLAQASQAGQLSFGLIDGAAGNPAGYYLSNTAQPSVWPRGNRGRAAMSWKVGTVPRVSDRGYSAAVGLSQNALVGTFPTEAAIGYRRYDNASYLNGNVKRVVVWAKQYSQAWLDRQTTQPKTLHLLGDSFVTADYMKAAADYMADDDRSYSFNGVGGSTLAAQAARYVGGTVTLADTGNSQTAYNPTNNGDGTYTYAGDPTHWGKTVVLLNGGLDSTLAANKAAIDAIAAKAGRLLLVEPAPSSDITAGSAGRIDWDAHRDALRDYVGAERWVPTLTRALALGDGGANDNADIAASLWPRSLRVDNIHPTTPGWGSVIGYQVAGKLATNGW